MKKIILVLFIFSLLILLGCSKNKDITGDVVKDTKEETQNLEKEPIEQSNPESNKVVKYVCPDGKTTVENINNCPKPKEEPESEPEPQEEKRALTEQELVENEENYPTCIESLFKEVCEKYDLIYNEDYDHYEENSALADSFSCSDDGIYTLDEMGDEDKYLYIHTSGRILRIKCGTYQEPTNTKEKCMENLFENLCQEKNLLYNDYVELDTVFMIRCSDDGFYQTMDELFDNSYEEIRVIKTIASNKCS